MISQKVIPTDKYCSYIELVENHIKPYAFILNMTIA